MSRGWFSGEDLIGKMVFGMDLGGTKWAFNDEKCQKIAEFFTFRSEAHFSGKNSSGKTLPERSFLSLFLHN